MSKSVEPQRHQRNTGRTTGKKDDSLPEGVGNNSIGKPAQGTLGMPKARGRDAKELTCRDMVWQEVKVWLPLWNNEIGCAMRRGGPASSTHAQGKSEAKQLQQHENMADKIMDSYRRRNEEHKQRVTITAGVSHRWAQGACTDGEAQATRGQRRDPTAGP